MRFRHLAAALASAAFLSAPVLAGTVLVTPANMNGWNFGSFDASFAPDSGPTAGTGDIVTGPATPPLGVGSAHLSTSPGTGDGGEIIGTNNFNGTALSALTSLGYWAYSASNNGSQFPYLDVVISTDGKPIDSSGSNLDFITFEPPYQQPSTGNPSLPDQGPTVMDQWQSWNVLEGGLYDRTIGGDGGDHVVGLSAFTAAYPNATIADPSSVFPGFYGIDLQVGFADPAFTYDGNVDDFTLGTSAGTTTVDFDPTPVPLPATVWSGGVLMLGVLGYRLMRRKVQTA